MSDSAKSFILSIIIHLVVIAAFIFDFAQKIEIPKVSLVIDARLIGEVAKHASNDSKKKSANKAHSDGAASGKDLAHEKHDDHAQKTLPIHQPLPEIPQDLRSEAFNSYAIARFYIAASGHVENVELVKPCSNPKLNYLLLKSLKDWRFNSSSKSSTQDIRVTFKVE